jgi:hypothetical protein
VAGAGGAALVGGGSQVLGHLHLEHFLEHSLDDLTQEVWVLEQDLLCKVLTHFTMIFGHRRSVSDRLT